MKSLCYPGASVPRLLILVLSVLAVMTDASGQDSGAMQKSVGTAGQVIPGQYIVVYKKDPSARIAETGSVSARQQRVREEVSTTLDRHRLSDKPVLYVYETALQGFAVSGLTEAEAERLRSDDRVAYVVPDTPVFLHKVTSAPMPPAGTCGGRTVTINGVADYTIGLADFGSNTTDASGEVILVDDGTANPTEGCSGIIQDLTGKIALIDRGTCNYSVKAYNAQLKGAVGVIIANNVAGAAPTLGAGTNAALVTIPVMSVTQAAGNSIKAALGTGIVTAIVDPTAPDYTSQCTPWGITRVGGGVSCADGPCNGRAAWIIDSGIDLDHPDLNVDTERGAYFIGSDANDGNGHGTHVAGTVAARDNDFGVIGVAAGALVVPVRVFPNSGSSPNSVIIAGINYVAANAASNDVANLSLGGMPDQALENAVLALAQVCRVVVSAGNDAIYAGYVAPARLNGPNLYTVSAIDNTDRLADFSNYGSEIVDYAAPGVGIVSCWLNGGYNRINGTSMAAPHVAGLLLLGTICANSRVVDDAGGNPEPIATRYDPDNVAANNADGDGDGYTICNDPDDTDPNVYPGAPEICDGKDNNGNGNIDEGNVCCLSGNTGTLYVNANATGGNTGLSWSDAFTSLEPALAAARYCTQITRIWVAGGTYYPATNESGQTNPVDPRTKSFAMRNNLAIYGGFAGNEGDGYDLSQRDLVANKTTLSGNIQQDNNPGNNVYHVIVNFPASGSTINATAVLDGLTVAGGSANVLNSDNSHHFPKSCGGGMLNYNASPVIRNCSFENSQAYLGGGVFNMSSSPAFSNCSFIRNLGEYGGGLCEYSSSSVISNSVFQLNQSIAYGGGIANLAGSNLAVTNVSFSGNSATTSGGGIYNELSSSVIRNSIFWGNNSQIAGTSGLYYSIIQGGWAGTGGDNLDTDPQFINQPVIGATTPGNLRIRPCSGAIDAGDPASTAGTAGATDAAGNIRFFGGRIDIGAYELQSGPVRVTITANPGLAVNAGGSTVLTASGADSYLWSTTETSAAITVSPEESTTYNVTGTSIAGACSATAGVTVSVNPLPVTLVSFSARAQENGSVKLSWATTQETNNAYFEIERSSDFRQTELLARVAPGSGTGNLTRSYGFTDEAPYKGISYYRLTQVDIDGARTLYNWVSVAIDNTYAVFPNPVVKSSFRLQLDDPAKAVIRLYNAEGKPVHLQTRHSGEGFTDLKLPTHIPAGIYLLQVEERGLRRQYRVVVE